jgi:DNA helicase IV
MEEIDDIAKKIERHRNLEIIISANNSAIGRSYVSYNNVMEQFWLLNSENLGSGTPIRDINNSIIGRQTGSVSTYTGDGKTIYKNLKIGEILIENHEGVHQLNTRNGIIDLEIFNRATYKPSNVEGEYATDIIIRRANDIKINSYRVLSEILKRQKDIDESKAQLESATEEEAKLLITQIAKKEEEKRNFINQAQTFIRKYAELRYQPILDPLQEAIKRSKIFNGVLIINGGPGTGKTTSLIQRIKFLISTSIEEYKQLTRSQKEILYNQKTSWIFYSPNELLALFLRNSMKLEELTADSDRVKVWSSHKNELIKTYRFVSETKRPFLIYNKSNGVNLFSNSSTKVVKIIKDLDKFYLSFQKDKLNKVSEIDVSTFAWKIVGKSIQDYIKGKGDIKNIEDLIRLYINLTKIFKEETEAIAEEYTTLIKTVSSRIQVIILKDTERTDTLSVLLKQWKSEAQDNEDDEDDDDIEIDQDDFDEKEDLSTFDFQGELFTKLKSICRKQALSKYDKNTKLSKRDKELILIIPEVSDQLEYNLLGQTAFFKKFFERITKGISVNILREIPMIYKKYRRQQLNLKSRNWKLKMLEDLVKKDKNSRIHSDEQALLLSFVNKVALKIYKTSQVEYKSINHSYLKGFKENCKPVIAIDEATDFSIIDLIAINSFGHPELSSVTLSGDIMQRMTSEGITSWEDFTNAIPKSEVKNLQVSYRQSQTLLSLAKIIYQKSTGQIANYESYIEKDEAEPKPLMLISQDEDDKLQWIATRILEIYRAYNGSIPSIAIFLSDENLLESFAKELGELDTLADVGILVKACRDGQVLGDKNTVRVFSIKVIKGLEFESVFFHNFDSLQKQHLEKDLLLKYLYVGLSRATFYLGLTLSNELSNDISYIEDYFDRSGRTWELLANRN